MDIIYSEGAVHVGGLGDFSLKDTLDCGQCFRWSESGGGFDGIVEGRFCHAEQRGDTLLLSTTREDFDALWRDYFDLDRDYAALRREFSTDETLRAALAFAPGIRVLRQRPWETLCSYIISQNNNIKRIKGIIARMCESFGEPLCDGRGYAFPSAGRLATLDEQALAPLRCGFRAKYILDAAEKVASGEIDLAALRDMELDEARRTLMSIRGVGPKVAECTLLYGFGRTECFPIDVWIRRAMSELFPAGLPECAVREAGIAQQYIFHYMRMRAAGD